MGPHDPHRRRHLVDEFDPRIHPGPTDVVQGGVALECLQLHQGLFRALAGHFTPQQHFGFEAAAWYWHFVDVVWLGLYFLVYWL